jgi:hypothetical protein
MAWEENTVHELTAGSGTISLHPCQSIFDLLVDPVVIFQRYPGCADRLTIATGLILDSAIRFHREQFEILMLNYENDHIMKHSESIV